MCFTLLSLLSLFILFYFFIYLQFVLFTQHLSHTRYKLMSYNGWIAGIWATFSLNSYLGNVSDEIKKQTITSIAYLGKVMKGELSQSFIGMRKSTSKSQNQSPGHLSHPSVCIKSPLQRQYSILSKCMRNQYSLKQTT